jgi:hypothetical protein
MEKPLWAELFESESDFERVNQLTAIRLGETYLEIMTYDDSNRRKLMNKRCE